MAAIEDKYVLKVQCPSCQTKLDLSDLPAFSDITCPKCTAAMVVPKWFQNILLEEVLSIRPGLQVFRALDPTLDREACVKLMLTKAADTSPLPSDESPYQEKQLNAFLEIFRKVSLLVHPHIVPVCSCSALDEAVYGVTRYVAGAPLNRATVKNGRPPWLDVQVHTQAAVDALNHAAGKQLFHGHLTPENLLIDQDGALHLTDFMTAQAAGKNLSKEPYTAPELTPATSPNCKSDIFSLGVCLYEYATGSLPCPEQRDAWQAGLLRPLPPQELNPTLPQRYSELLLEMLSIAPVKRPLNYARINEVLAELRGSSKRAWAGKKAHGHRLLLAKGQTRPQIKLITPRKRQRSWFNLLLGLLILSALCLVGIILFRQAPVQEKLHSLGLLQNGKLKLQVVPNPAHASKEVAPAGEDESVSVPDRLPEQSGFRLPPEIIALRPRPADYDFKASREEISAYLTAVPPAALEIEKERIRYLGSYKTYLLSKISKMAYSPGNPEGIRLKTGEKVFGSVTMFSNEKALKIRLSDRASSSLREIPWQDLSCRQVLDMAYSYVQRTTAEIKDLTVIPRKKSDDVYDEYFYLILLADWYQESAALKQFCQEVEQLPIVKAKEKLSKYIEWPL